MGRGKRKKEIPCETYRNEDEFHRIDELGSHLHKVKMVSKNKIKYANVPFAFDIETSSFYEGNEKRAIMYAFVLGFNGKCFLGRTWEEFLSALDVIAHFYGTGEDCRVIIWVQNLPYEFQWMRKWLDIEYVFALDERKPVEVRLTNGIVFRCTYALSGYSLESIGKNLLKYRVEKKVGDLDYSLIRHAETPLNAKEWGYIINDGLVVMAYVQEQIEQFGKITRIPLTNTGKVRRYCRNACIYPSSRDHKKCVFESLKYRRIMEQLTLEKDEYEMIKRAFQGGFTHSNPINTNQVIEDVTSFDFTSSYPAVMVYSDRFPMTKGEKIEIESRQQFEKMISVYACIFDIRFTNIRAKECIDFPISLSKCSEIKGEAVSNGRIIRAKVARMVITELDYEVIDNFYEWDKMEIGEFWKYGRGYLPTNLVKSILDLYEKKTTLKGVEGMENEYMNSKSMINAVYGMSATDPIRGTNDYKKGEWIVTDPDIEKSLEIYNNSFKRFLSYAWSVYVTALARWNLFTGILECGEDYVYADTDSIKIRHGEKHLRYIERYNERVVRLLKDAMRYHGFPFELCKPKTIKGEEKMLGLWDFDGKYKRFKTLGAKRYLVEYEDHEIDYGKVKLPYSLTNSGLNKKIVTPWLYEKAQKEGKSIFDVYEDDLYIPKGKTGKNIHTYIDEPTSGNVQDYLGEYADYEEKSSIHMEESDYSLSMGQEFLKLLFNIKETNYGK